MLHETLSFKSQIKTVSQSCIYHLRNLNSIRSHFSKPSIELAIHAYITTRLDYCNSLYIGLPDTTLRPLQVAQNFAARIIFRQSKFTHVTPLLKSLHWLPIKARIEYKTLLLTYKALNDQAPNYISSLLKYYEPSRTLRSSDSVQLNVPRTSLATMGDRAFSVAGPKFWNISLSSVDSNSSLNIFKKTFKNLFILQVLLHIIFI